VSDAELRKRLISDPLPGEIEAGRRAWSVVRASFGSRERVPWIERHSRAVLALAAVAALAVAAITPPGRALVERVREVAGNSPSEPALLRLPTEGRLLVESGQGPWVVQDDGSKRRLGSYEAASWSPRGLFIVATRGRRLVALEPDGDIRWTITRPGRVTHARWAPSGFRIAYREGDGLRVVVGNGANDRLLVRPVAPVAPAWRPGSTQNVLAYADPAGRIHVLDVDTRERLWSTAPGRPLTQLVWAADGSRLVALSRGERETIYDGGGQPTGTVDLPPGHVIVRAAFAPTGDALAYTDFDLATDTSAVVLVEAGRRRMLFTGEGRLEDVVWSPDGRWLLVTWPSADQWLFFRTPSVRGIVAVSNVGREFDPGETGPPGFPRAVGWAEDDSG
jgi:hypothetical protein